MFNYGTIYISLWRAWALREGQSWAQFRISLRPVLEKLDESCIFSNLNRNYLGREQTVVNLYDFDGNIL